MIAALPVELREPLVLRELEELSYKEIADITAHPDRHRDVTAVSGAPAAGASRRRPATHDRRCRNATRSCWFRPSSMASSTPRSRRARGAPAGCPVCQAAAAELRRARALIGEDLYEPMPADARARMLARSRRRRPEDGADSHRTGVRPRPAFSRSGAQVGLGWWRSVASFGLGAACAAVLAFWCSRPAEASLAEQVVAGHIRAAAARPSGRCPVERPPHGQALV